MLGQGMPWHIIMVFFIIGAVMGGMSGQKKQAPSKYQLDEQNKQL